MNSQQRFYLDAMGIQVWERRETSPPTPEGQAVSPSSVPEQQEAAAPVVEMKCVPPSPQAAVTAPQFEAEAGQSQADDGIPAYLDEAPAPELPMPEMEDGSDFAETDALSGAVQNDVAGLDWGALQRCVSDCVACPELVANRSQTVFGVGNPQADWMLIGEAPGVDEDRQGEPFVGKAGQLLNAMLQALGLKRQQVYITNVLKCRPPNNRDPQPDEAAACEAYLRRQIALVQPKVILVVGRIAAQNLLKVDTPIGKLRGSVHQYEGNIPVVATYHPAYLLRSPSEKRKSWADLCLARNVLEGD
ncbi:MAG: uracil-DNA glycosylase [Pseudomonadota bacterium]